jgi:hypothetical protein
MTTFDQILPKLEGLFEKHCSGLARLGRVVVNRDLNGRIRIIVDKAVHTDPEAEDVLKGLTAGLSEVLGPHAWSPERSVLFESETELEAIFTAPESFALEGLDEVRVIDRLATEGSWARIEPISPNSPRIVFYSIKGGVGRSTALAASAWSLAEAGQRVMVLDLDLESPGLSSALLPHERRPQYGIADWLVEDLVDNGNAVFEEMVATSTLSHDGEIYVIPAHGQDPGEYVAKLGRVWMPKVDAQGNQEGWSRRLARLIDGLEARWTPDVILIDSRAGIDEMASSCVTDLGAALVLLFAIDGEQTWSGYRILFQYWRRTGGVEEIRERLQLVGAMIPELGAAEYHEGLREQSADLFTNELYDAIPPGEVIGERFNFDATDPGSPHYPWGIRWNRGFAALRSMHSRLEAVDPTEVKMVFGDLLDNLHNNVGTE